MAKRFNMSQFRSQIRQLESKQRQLTNKINTEVRKANNDIKRAVNQYNSSVRRYNAQVQRNKQIISREIRKLQLTNSIHYSYTSSVRVMHYSYIAVNNAYPEGIELSTQQERILDLVEQEHANSVITANAIENDESPLENTEDFEINNKLLIVSADLSDRWSGAVYSLNPINPDATRHFCTSAREIFTEFIELKAPDDVVFQFNPSCETTERGNPTRREKIKYMMRNMQMDESVVSFAEADITNILELFHVLSDGTHGEAGKYSYEKLQQVKKRVEQGINFLCEISA